MDPNETLRRFLEAAIAMHRADASGDASELDTATDTAFEASSELSSWIAHGGFAPDWQAGVWSLLETLPEADGREEG